MAGDGGPAGWTMPNRLIDESSAYLLQHAHNPVDWYPWCEEAFERARTEDKPVLLSIGYSACHWCHVMAHESFEDKTIAALMNQCFVNIKVDREERPDLDAVYMRAVQSLTGSGGWPLTVFLTPQAVPFYGGTYFPPEDRHGLPSFLRTLRAVADAYARRRDEVDKAGQDILGHLSEAGQIQGNDSSLNPSVLDEAYRGLWNLYDTGEGGFGGAPKFPMPMVLTFLLNYQLRIGSEDALAVVEHSLSAMAKGGMYDQLGGGFHRYATDRAWMIPHFEKMLYDNAQLARIYLRAWQVTGNPFYRTIAEAVLDYVIREMTDPAGGFYSTQDADSEGEEGKFFVWTPDEIRDALEEEAEPFMEAYGVTIHGNFEGKNILEFVGDTDQRPALADARRKLLEAREQRIHPGLDDKVLTSWNGLMMAAFAEAARVLVRDDYRVVAERNADFLLCQLRQDDGRLLHTWKNGDARFNGYLEDYSYLMEGLLEMYQTTFEPQWFVAAQELAETMIARFSTPDGGFYDTSDDHEALITRPRDLQDNATPSGNAMAVTTLLKLAGFTNELRYVDIAHQALAQMQAMMAQYPLGFGQWLQALNYALSQPREIAIVGDPQAADTHALLDVCTSGYRPYQLVAVGSPSYGDAVPLLRGRSQVGGKATAYVCTNFTCCPPVTDPVGLEALL